MCECLQEIADSYSYEYERHNMPAWVTISPYMTIRIRPYAKDGKLSKRGTERSIDVRYCPVCGERLNGDTITAGR